MGQIGPGGSYQQPFQPKRDTSAAQNTNSASVANTNAYQNTSQTQGSFTAQAIQALSQLLLSPMAGQTASLSAMQLSILLKSLLQLPKELQQLLAEVVSGNSGEEAAKVLQQLLTENPELQVNLEELQAHLGKALQSNNKKLLQMMQSSNQALSDNSQSMGELLSTMSKLSSQVKQNPVQALNTTLLLYLPWYPLAEQQRLTLHFEAPEQDGESDGKKGDASQNAHLVMLLDTNQLGRFKITTLPLLPNQLMFHVEHDAAVNAYQASIQHQLNQSLTHAGMLAPECEWKKRGVSRHLFDDSTQPLRTEDETMDSVERENKQSVVVHNVGHVPVQVVQGAYWFARIILEIDNQAIEGTASQTPE